VASSAGHARALIVSARRLGKPALCQRITVSGLTTANAASVIANEPRQPDDNNDRRYEGRFL